jgi:hypothetical protein
LRARIDPRDEIQLRNGIGGNGASIMNLNRTMGGSFIKTVDVET